MVVLIINNLSFIGKIENSSHYILPSCIIIFSLRRERERDLGWGSPVMDMSIRNPTF